MGYNTAATFTGWLDRLASVASIEKRVPSRDRVLRAIALPMYFILSRFSHGAWPKQQLSCRDQQQYYVMTSSAIYRKSPPPNVVFRAPRFDSAGGDDNTARRCTSFEKKLTMGKRPGSINRNSSGKNRSNGRRKRKAGNIQVDDDRPCSVDGGRQWRKRRADEQKCGKNDFLCNQHLRHWPVWPNLCCGRKLLRTTIVSMMATAAKVVTKNRTEQKGRPRKNCLFVLLLLTLAMALL